jgi:hypothetical protein
MNDSTDSKTDPSSEFLRQWSESFSRILQTAGTFTPDSMPPEMMRQIRSGIFQALAKSWEEFMRSPQFLESTKQMMDNAVAFRKMSSDFLTKTRQEFQGTSRGDVDDLLQAMREMEARLTRRVDDLAAQVQSQRPQPGEKVRRPANPAHRPARKKSSSTQKAAPRKSAARK